MSLTRLLKPRGGGLPYSGPVQARRRGAARGVEGGVAAASFLQRGAAKLSAGIRRLMADPLALVRMTVVGPELVYHHLFVRGLVADGRAGRFRSLQRAFAESMRSPYLLQYDLSSAGEAAD